KPPWPPGAAPRRTPRRSPPPHLRPDESEPEMDIPTTLLTLLAGPAALLLALFLFNRLMPITAARAGLGLERRLAGLHVKRVYVPGFDMPYLEGGDPARPALV